MKRWHCFTFLPALTTFFLSCGGGGGGKDAGAEVDIPVVDVPSDVSDTGTDAGPDEAVVPDTADPGVVEAAIDVPSDKPPDIPLTTCCVYDLECGPSMQCVKEPGEVGACKPKQVKGMCWTAKDCEPGQVCQGAIPCPCEWKGEGDGCDIPGNCIPKAPGCCNSDMDCPVKLACGPGKTCVQELEPGQCWKDGDCYMTQKCIGMTVCPCGVVCGVGTFPGKCDPLPKSCCNQDKDCAPGEVCRFHAKYDKLPGRCVPSPDGPKCPGDFACCWADQDCVKGWCDGAYGCGCIDLCPTCGACAEDKMGACGYFAIDVNLTMESAMCKTDPSGNPVMTHYEVLLKWKTSKPAKSTVEFALNAFTGNEGFVPFEDKYLTDHEFLVGLSHFFFGKPPKPGDNIVFRVRVEGEGGGKGLSDTLSIPVDQPIADCLYPFDKVCSDGLGILCRMVPPPCGKGKVMAAIDGCERCVYPKTCNCNDGVAPSCPQPPPKCDGGKILAEQGGCFACVNPMTCE